MVHRLYSLVRLTVSLSIIINSELGVSRRDTGSLGRVELRRVRNFAKFI